MKHSVVALLRLVNAIFHLMPVAGWIRVASSLRECKSCILTFKYLPCGDSHWILLPHCLSVPSLNQIIGLHIIVLQLHSIVHPSRTVFSNQSIIYGYHAMSQVDNIPQGKQGSRKPLIPLLCTAYRPHASPKVTAFTTSHLPPYSDPRLSPSHGDRPPNRQSTPVPNHTPAPSAQPRRR